MTITSKRRFDDHGNVSYSKHKIFLYREDFEKFEEGFLDAVDKIQELMATGEYRDPIAERAAQESEATSEAIHPTKTALTARKTSPSTTSESLIKRAGCA